MIHFSSVGVIAALFLGMVHSVPFAEDTTFSADETAALTKLKELTTGKIPETSVVATLAKDDLYFVRWLRATKNDAQAAFDMLQAHLKYRDTMKLDGIDKKDFAKMEKDYPIFLDTKDKTGRPIAEAWLSDWDLRTGMTISGEGKEIDEWALRAFELHNRKALQLKTSGEKVSQSTFLVDLKAYSVLKQGCPTCIQFFTGLVEKYENHYPGMLHEFVFYNTPEDFSIVLNTLMKNMRPETQKVIKVYKTKAEGDKALDEQIEKSERSTNFGGTKTRSRKSVSETGPLTAPSVDGATKGVPTKGVPTKEVTNIGGRGMGGGLGGGLG